MTGSTAPLVGSQLNEILERIADIQLTVSIPGGTTVSGQVFSGGSITDAFPYPVTDPNIGNVPFFYNDYLGGPATISAVSGVQEIKDNFEMTLCAMNAVSEYTMADAIQEMCFWRDAVMAAFSSSIRLGNDLSYILEAIITNVSKFQKISIGSAEYFGMTFTLSVTEWYSVAIIA